MLTVRFPLRKQWPPGRSSAPAGPCRPIRCSGVRRACRPRPAASSQPSRMPATTAAQAPVPQASVSPAPRSNTRSAICERDSTCMKPALTLCGKQSSTSISGPSAATSAVSTSSTRCTACGLPIDSTATSTLPSISSSGHNSKSLKRARHHARGQEGNVLELEVRRFHVDGDAAVVAQLQFDLAVDGLDLDAALVGQAALAHEAHEAARAVAAMFDLVAAGVEDAVAEVHARRARRLDHQDLVGTDAEMPVGQRAELLGAELQRLAGGVEHDEVVARALHLGEAQFHRAIMATARRLAPPPHRWRDMSLRRCTANSAVGGQFNTAPVRRAAAS